MSRARTWLRATGHHGAWIAIWSVIGWTGTLATPLLMEHPLLLMLLAPRAVFVALAVDSASLVPFVVLGTLRLGVTDASYFILGRRSPQTAPVRHHRTGGWFGGGRKAALAWADTCCRWLCSHGFKAGTVLFFRPNGKYLAVAGAYGVSSRVAAATSVIGTMLCPRFLSSRDWTAHMTRMLRINSVPHESITLDTVTVIVPTKNEAENIAVFLRSLPATVHLIVVDASTDEHRT